MTPTAFRAAGRGPAITSRARGTTLSLTLSEPAKLALKIRSRSGSVEGTIRTAGKPGAGTLRFMGRVDGRALRPGRYRMAVTATSASGSRRATTAVDFRITR